MFAYALASAFAIFQKIKTNTKVLLSSFEVFRQWTQNCSSLQFWVVSSVNSKLLLVVLLMAFEQNWSKIEEITHPSTNRPQCCLTYLIIDLVVMFFGYWLFIGYLVKILDIKNQYFLFLLKEIISLMQIKDYNRLISFFNYSWTYFLFRGIL